MTKKMKEDDEKLLSEKKTVSDVHAETDIYYDSVHTMDLYYPLCQEENKMLVLDIHGGAWVYGDKKYNQHFCMNLSKHGFPVFNMNYSLVPEVDVKKQVQQIFDAIRFIRANYPQYRSYRLCLSGDSAGAHLASLCAAVTKYSYLQMQYEVYIGDIKIDALLLQHGVYQLQPMRESNNLMMKVLHRWMFPQKNITDCLWPCLDKNWDIPVFLLSSEQDEMFCRQTLRLAKRLEELSCPHELLFWDKSYEKLRHVFHIAFPDLEESQVSIEKMAQFLKNQ